MLFPPLIICLLIQNPLKPEKFSKVSSDILSVQKLFQRTPEKLHDLSLGTYALSASVYVLVQPYCYKDENTAEYHSLKLRDKPAPACRYKLRECKCHQRRKISQLVKL